MSPCTQDVEQEQCYNETRQVQRPLSVCVCHAVCRVDRLYVCHVELRVVSPPYLHLATFEM